MNTVPDPQVNYESLVNKEDIFVNRIETCSIAIDAVLHAIYKVEGPLHLETSYEIVSATHDIQVKLERELIFVRAEKRLALTFVLVLFPIQYRFQHFQSHRMIRCRSFRKQMDDLPQRVPMFHRAEKAK